MNQKVKKPPLNPGLTNPKLFDTPGENAAYVVADIAWREWIRASLLEDLIQDINFDSYGFSHEEVASKTANAIRKLLLEGKEYEPRIEI